MGYCLTHPHCQIPNAFWLKRMIKLSNKEGDCASRYAPCSTFKIAISLMGYEEGLLVDKTHPKLPFKEGYVDLA